MVEIIETDLLHFTISWNNKDLKEEGHIRKTNATFASINSKYWN